MPTYGKPDALISDHRMQFTSDKYIKALENANIKPNYSSIRHLQSNIVGRVHRELSRFFRTIVRNNQKCWLQFVKIIQNIMNESHYDTTNFTPMELHSNVKPTQV